jgi:hypothetical protein
MRKKKRGIGRKNLRKNQKKIMHSIQLGAKKTIEINHVEGCHFDFN